MILQGFSKRNGKEEIAMFVPLHIRENVTERLRDRKRKREIYREKNICRKREKERVRER